MSEKKNNNMLIIEELRDIPIEKVSANGYKGQHHKLSSSVIGDYNSASIPLFRDVTMVYFSGVPTQTFRMRYSHYYHDNITLNMCLSGKVTHDNAEAFSVPVGTGQSFIYDVNKDSTLIEFQKGKKFEQVCLIFSKEQFNECLDRFFDENMEKERKTCLEAVFSGQNEGKVFDIAEEVKLICRQILSCRLRDNFRKVFLECKLFEMLAYYFQSFTIGYEEEFVLDAEEIQKIQLAKKIITEQDQIQNFSVEDLCKEVDLNRFKLNLGFQTIYNTSIIKFYRSCILNKAHSELLDNNNPITIKALAQKYGYTNSSAFSKAFFKEFGLRPAQVRKKRNN